MVITKGVEIGNEKTSVLVMSVPYLVSRSTTFEESYPSTK